MHCVSWNSKSINVVPTCYWSTLCVLHFFVEMPVPYMCVSLVNATKNKIYTFLQAVPSCFCRWSHRESVAAVFSEALTRRMCFYMFLIIKSRNTVCVCQGTPTSNADFVYSTWYSRLEWRVFASPETLVLNLKAVQSWVSLRSNVMYMCCSMHSVTRMSCFYILSF